MSPTRHRKLLFAGLGAATVAFALALSVNWIVINWRAGVWLVLGVFFFLAIITGAVLNTIFLVREIRRNEQHNNFINAVTHELKTPVASIRLYLETLKTRPVDEIKRKQFYDIMLADSDRLLHTIDQVLKAGQAGSHRRLEAHAVDLTGTISECLSVARYRHHLPDAAIEFSNALPSGSAASVIGDADDVRTAILNLIDNAVKYSGQQVKVLVELARNEDQFMVRVKDNGIGIPRNELRKVFQRFYRIQNTATARIKGTGLGLFIVSSIARRHNGKVYAESAGQGRGSIFTLQLPAARKEARGSA